MIMVRVRVLELTVLELTVLQLTGTQNTRATQWQERTKLTFLPITFSTGSECFWFFLFAPCLTVRNFILIY